MIDVKEFANKNYEFRELPDNVSLLKKVIKDSKGVKYKIRILLDTDGFDPEVEYNTTPRSYLRLEIEDGSTLDEIEKLFETAWNAMGSKYF